MNPICLLGTVPSIVNELNCYIFEFHLKEYYTQRKFSVVGFGVVRPRNDFCMRFLDTLPLKLKFLESKTLEFKFYI